MYKPSIKATYCNAYAVLYDIGVVMFHKVCYKWLLIATTDGVVYDTVILPPDKYKQSEQSFTIYHGQDMPEVFNKVDDCTPQAYTEQE